MNVVFLKFHYDLSIAFEGFSVDSFEIADDIIRARSMLNVLAIVVYNMPDARQTIVGTYNVLPALNSEEKRAQFVIWAMRLCPLEGFQSSSGMSTCG